MELTKAYMEAKSLAEQRVLAMSDTDFLEWLELGDIESIKCCLVRYEQIEAYEKCAIIRDYLKIMDV